VDLDGAVKYPSGLVKLLVLLIVLGKGGPKVGEGPDGLLGIDGGDGLVARFLNLVFYKISYGASTGPSYLFGFSSKKVHPLLPHVDVVWVLKENINEILYTKKKKKKPVAEARR